MGDRKFQGRRDSNDSNKVKDRSSVVTAGEAEARGQCAADVVVGV